MPKKKKTKKRVKKKKKPLRKPRNRVLKKKSKKKLSKPKAEKELIIKTKKEWISKAIVNKSQYEKKYNESIKDNDGFWKK